MIKIIMDSGKEYTVENLSANDIKNRCYETVEIPSPFGKGQQATRFVNEFINISESIIINTSHISSIEEL